MNSPIATEHRNRMAEFQRQHRTGLVTLVFTDLVDSVALRRQLGDQAGTSLLQGTGNGSGKPAPASPD